ncbi:MAG: ral secretion pathway protein [Chthoniobacter sp.]|nr:ral secretion pathway protein [Chthoniobacter sp.]
MKIICRPSPAVRAFTLVELLTVIAIIAILMGLLFPAIGVVKEQARKVQAKTDVTNIVASVKQYYTEYGKYPPVDLKSTNTTDDSMVGDKEAQATTDNNALFDTLRARDSGINVKHALNPRRIVFFESKSVSDPKNPRSGFADKSDSPSPGSFYDPWGKQYNIIMDSNYDNVITIEKQYKDFAAENSPRVGCGAFALGKDNKLGTDGDQTYKKGSTISDDVISWQ